jgi:hypothetical protein
MTDMLMVSVMVLLFHCLTEMSNACWQFSMAIRYILRNPSRIIQRALSTKFVDVFFDESVKDEIFDQSQLQTANQTQRNIAKMILSKPLCIIVWMYPEMMR